VFKLILKDYKMNPRVKELAEQAGGVVLAGSEIQKFAELLVRECARISKETCNELKTDETIQMPALATSVNLYHATLRNKLDEHFGVEL